MDTREVKRKVENVIGRYDYKCNTREYFCDTLYGYNVDVKIITKYIDGIYTGTIQIEAIYLINEIDTKGDLNIIKSLITNRIEEHVDDIIDILEDSLDDVEDSIKFKKIIRQTSNRYDIL